MRECAYYLAEGELLHCKLCPFHCRIAEGDTGRCGVRQHRSGQLFSLSYGQITGVSLDPIEKKPLYHFHPGSHILSIGSFGCNLTCGFCQNWKSSQERPPAGRWTPQEAAQHAAAHRGQGNIGLAYTYNEPTIWFEYIRDTAPLVRGLGMKNVLVTNGIIEAEPLAELLPVVDAMNVDIKGIRPEFYRKLCGGDGLAARRTVEMAWGRCAVEITNLIIPGENDSDADLIDLFDWAASVSRKLPVHLSRYHPAWKMTSPPTPVPTMERAFQLACERLDFVYVGNVHIDDTTNTVCPDCGAAAVERQGFETHVRTEDGRCPSCGGDLGIAI